MKIISSLLLLATIGLTHSAYAQDPSYKMDEVPETLSCAEVDIVFSFDLSGSTSSSIQRKNIQTAVNSLIHHYQLSEDGLKIGLTGFTGLGTGKILANLSSDIGFIEQTIKRFPQLYKNGTSLAEGIYASMEAFSISDASYPNRRDSKKILVMFTDGEECGYQPYVFEGPCQYVELFQRYTIEASNQLRFSYGDLLSVYVIAVPSYNESAPFPFMGDQAKKAENQGQMSEDSIDYPHLYNVTLNSDHIIPIASYSEITSAIAQMDICN